MIKYMLSKNFKLLLLFNLILPLIFFMGRDSMGAVALPDGFTHELVASGMTEPVGLTFLPDGRILVIEQQGTVRLVVNGSLQPGPILDIQSQVRHGGEQGLLGIAVDPEYPTRPFIYLYYTHETENFQYITRFTMTGTLTDPLGTDLPADPASSFYLLTDIPRNAGNHNGGTLRFGPDDMLYAGPGDDAGDCVSQLRDDLRGVILRMDVSGLPLDNSVRDHAAKSEMVPLDNPFASALNDNERLVWAYGLRNPFRFSFDSVTGNLFIGDVGEDTYEEISMSVAPGGENFGWPYREGYDINPNNPTCFGGPEPVAETVGPIGGYSQVSDGYSIIGGGVYHPVNYPNDLSWPSEFDGDYFFADYYQGFLIRLKDQGVGTWAVPPPVPGQPSPEYLITGLSSPSDFTIGPDGAVYYISQWDGSIYKLGSLGNSDISVSPASRDFGNVTEGDTSTARSFTLTNSGSADLVIGTISITGTDAAEFGIQNDLCSGQTIAPSGSCTIEAVFSPKTEGAKSASLSIPSNDPDTPTPDVPLSGVGGSCNYSISPESQSFFSDGGTGSVSVIAPDGCEWTSTSNGPSWITITSGNSGSGNGTVNYSVSPNADASSRTGTIAIAGKTFTATQAEIGSNPAPKIMANGSGNPITLGTGDTLSVDVSLVAGSNLDVDCDWWVSVNTPFLPPDDWFSYNLSSVWTPGLTFAYQGPLFNLAPFEVLNMSGLPEGTYNFYFAIDTNMNGFLDFNQRYYDLVTVNIVLTDISMLASSISMLVTPNDFKLAPGGEIELKVEVFDKFGNLLINTPRAPVIVTWKSSDESVAGVDKEGVVKGVGLGATTITANTGGVTKSATVTVELSDMSALEMSPTRLAMDLDSWRRFYVAAIDKFGSPTTLDCVGGVSAEYDDTYITANYNDTPGEESIDVYGKQNGSTLLTLNCGGFKSSPVIIEVKPSVAIPGPLSTDFGIQPSLAIENGIIHIASYDQSNSNLFYNNFQGRRSGETLLGAGDYGRESQIVLDPLNSNRPIICAVEGTGLSCWTLDNTGFWTKRNIDTISISSTIYKGDISAVVNSKGEVYILYYNVMENKLKLAKSISSSRDDWSVETRLTNGGRYNAMALGPDDVPRIAMQQGNKAYYGAMDDHGHWSFERIDDTPDIPAPGTGIRLALSTGNRPQVVYYMGGKLIHARKDSGTWSKDVIETVDVGGNYTFGLDLNRHSQPRVSYYDDDEKTMRYAYRLRSRRIGAPNRWRIDTPSAGTNVGTFSELKLDDYDRANIAYYDGEEEGNHKVRYYVEPHVLDYSEVDTLPDNPDNTLVDTSGVPVPTGVTATAIGNNITVSWNIVNGASSYKIFLNTTGNVTKGDEFVTVNSENSGTINNLSVGITYYFTVSSQVDFADGPLSPETSATIKNPINNAAGSQHITIPSNSNVTAIDGGVVNTIQLSDGTTTKAGGGGDTIQLSDGTTTKAGGGGDTIQLGDGTTTKAGGGGDTILLGDGTTTKAGGGGNTIQLGDGTTTKAGGGGDTIQLGDGTTTKAGGSGNTIQLGDGTTTKAGGGGNTIQLGDGTTTKAGGSGNTIQLGEGTTTSSGVPNQVIAEP